MLMKNQLPTKHYRIPGEFGKLILAVLRGVSSSDRMLSTMTAEARTLADVRALRVSR